MKGACLAPEAEGAVAIGRWTGAALLVVLALDLGPVLATGAEGAGEPAPPLWATLGIVALLAYGVAWLVVRPLLERQPHPPRSPWQPSPGMPAMGTQFQVGPLSLDLVRHQVAVDGQRVELTATEFKLLAHLVEHRGEVHSRDQLLHSVWGYALNGYSRTVDTHIRRLREKLGVHSELIETVRGAGYRFRAEDG